MFTMGFLKTADLSRACFVCHDPNAYLGSQTVQLTPMSAAAGAD